MPMFNKDKLAEKSLGLVHACCKRFSGKGIEYDELFAAGSLGLAKAIDNFDESRNLQFSTYAFPVIMGEIKRLFRDGGTLRVSRSIKELSLKISRAAAEFRQEHGNEPTVSQLAKLLDTDEEKISDAINSAKFPLSLTADYDDEGNPQIDIAVDDIQDKITERLSLEQAIDSLDENDRKIISLRYYRNKTQTQTAKLLNMTQVQVSRREKKILELIRAKIAT